MSTTETAVLSTAARMVDEGGPDAVTLRGLGGAVGLSRGAPYRHFEDKDRLLAAVAARELAGQCAEIRAALARAADGRERLTRLLRGYVGWARRRPQRFKLVFALRKRADRDLEAAAAEARALVIEACRRAIPAGGENIGRSLMLLALAHGAADLAASGLMGEDFDAEAAVAEGLALALAQAAI
ncbi:MAG TPA: TetR/AcrR family transcriptional regulator [Caulobacteraceae bacterium]|nr:TetR/AcrR family transcriptional regulator [Caulobacteraceae bacterium]